MAYNFSDFKDAVRQREEWLVAEFGGLRTGRVNPSILDHVMVESYGTMMPVGHLAAISIEDAKTLRVAPWDNSQLKHIEKAIFAANLGVSIAPDNSGVRISFPDLTVERRSALAKIIKTKLEEARVALRQERDKVQNEIHAKEKAREINEDDKYRLKDELQRLVDQANQKLEELALKKEKEIMG